MGKKLTETEILGQKGINFIEKHVLDMGYSWSPTIALDTGIDGTIEICDPITRQPTNNIIRVQSKAGDSYFKNEHDDRFTFYPSEADVDHWRSGNAPVILIVSRPDEDEGYWVDIKEYFARENDEGSKGIVIRKADQRFNKDSANALVNVAEPKSLGLYLSPAFREETLVSNLLKAEFVGSLRRRKSKYSTRKEILRLKKNFSQREFILKGGYLISPHNLSTRIWDKFCEGDTEEVELGDLERNWQVELLNLCLNQFARKVGLHFAPRERYYYFPASNNLSDYTFKSKSLKQETSKTVFKGYQNRTKTGVDHYRHHGAYMNFVLVGDDFFIQIRPTFRYTKDGVKIHSKAPKFLQAMKRMLRNQGMMYLVILWSEILRKNIHVVTSQKVSRRNSFIKIGELVNLGINRGISDKDWQQIDDFYIKEGENEADIPY